MWAEWSVINAPDAGRLLHPINIKLPYYKITGDRSRYRSSNTSANDAPIKRHFHKTLIERKKTSFPISDNSEYGFNWGGPELELYPIGKK